jgi:hypothetical protein
MGLCIGASVSLGSSQVGRSALARDGWRGNLLGERKGSLGRRCWQIPSNRNMRDSPPDIVVDETLTESRIHGWDTLVETNSVIVVEREYAFRDGVMSLDRVAVLIDTKAVHFLVAVVAK